MDQEYCTVSTCVCKAAQAIFSILGTLDSNHAVANTHSEQICLHMHYFKCITAMKPGKFYKETHVLINSLNPSFAPCRKRIVAYKSESFSQRTFVVLSAPTVRNPPNHRQPTGTLYMYSSRWLIMVNLSYKRALF